MYNICQYSRTPYGRKRVRWLHIGGRWLARRDGALVKNTLEDAILSRDRYQRGSLPGYSYAYVEVGKRRPAF